jgi:hypothetical protein
MPEHHVSTMYGLTRKKKAALVEQGWHTIQELPDSVKLGAIAARQRRAVRQGEMVVEHSALDAALGRLQPPVVHIDFETVQPAIPVWPGCRPYDQVPVQLSSHFVGADGSVKHFAWLFDGVGDPRPEAARAILGACEGAATVTAYSASFERECIEHVAEACPEYSEALLSLASRLVDLLPVVRDAIYHPGFGGSFSLKRVLPVLVPSMSYEGLAIAEGETATAELARMIFARAGEMGEREREELRGALLAYCERDTEAMMRLAERLTELHTDYEPARETM